MPSPMDVTPSGIVTDVRPLQPQNARAPIYVTLSGIVREVRLAQSKNTKSPIDDTSYVTESYVTEDGTVISVML